MYAIISCVVLVLLRPDVLVHARDISISCAVKGHIPLLILVVARDTYSLRNTTVVRGPKIVTEKMDVKKFFVYVCIVGPVFTMVLRKY